MAAEATPGSVVAWWDGNRLAFGVVAGEEKGRVRLILERGQEARVRPSRVAFGVGPSAGAPGQSLEERRLAGERLKALVERLRKRAGEVEIALLWEIVTDGMDDADPPVLSVAELAELALDASDGESRGALILALLDDGLHFLRKNEDWTPRDREAVERLVLEKEQVARREADTRRLHEALAGVVRGEAWVARETDVERRALEALERLAVHEESAPDPVRKLALDALEGSGLRWDRPHEGAFRLLRRLGRFDSDHENLQVRRFGLRTGFSEELLEQARSRAVRGFDRDDRRDLTGLEMVTIDGPHTREIDDALSVEARDGGYRLGIHIADASAFVEPDDPVDREALARSLSYYMPDLRLPMLPRAISEEAASLVQGEERPALSFLVDLDAEGEVSGYEMVPSIVRSRSRLSYDEVDGSIRDESGPFAGMLVLLARVAALRQDARVRAGAVVMLTAEAEVHVQTDGSLEIERLPGDSPSRRAVTEAMVLAGQVAARFCVEAELPVIYRRQAVAGALPDLPPDGVVDPVLVHRVRRCLKRAEVGLEPGRHSSLGLEAYAQCTSPIRRYQDLATHRQILSSLRGGPPCYTAEAMQRIAASTEQAESDARRAERGADDYWKLRYLDQQAGQEVEALVLEADPRPFIQLVETLWEQPMNALSGVEPGQLVRLRIERVNPRAGLLSLRRVD